MQYRSRKATYVILWTAIIGQYVCLSQAGQHTPLANEVQLNSDLASVLRAPRHEQEIISEALRIIEHMEAAPTCNRLAALSLINECKSLEEATSDTKVDSEFILDEVKSEYAARLAVCELLSAKAAVPRQCFILVPSADACEQGGIFSSFSRRPRAQAAPDRLCYPRASQAKFEGCLKALRSEPQAWTSYSNARQNAVVMCRASRDMIEREKTLAIYKSLAEVVADLTAAYEIAAKELDQKMRHWLEEHLTFTEKIREEQTKVSMEVRANRDLSLGSFVELNRRADHLHQYLQQYEATIGQLQMFVMEMVTNMTRDSSKQAAAQQEELELYHDKAIDSLQLSVDTFTQGLTILSGSIEVVKNEADLTYTTLTKVRQGLTEVDIELQGIKNDTREINTVLKGSKDAFKTIAFIGGIIIKPKWLVAAAVAYGASLFGLWRSHNKVIGSILMFGGLGYFMHNFGALDQVGKLSLNALVALVGVTIFALTIFLCRWTHTTYLCVYEDGHGRKGILPRIEAPNQPTVSRDPRRLKTLLDPLLRNS